MIFLGIQLCTIGVLFVPCLSFLQEEKRILFIFVFSTCVGKASVMQRGTAFSFQIQFEVKLSF